MASSSSSSTCRSWKYDVFLSFRGEDTRKTFVDHLYSALHQHHILTYKDDVTLDRGDTIGPALKSAIHESHIALIIFSENYADSSWCLDELSYIMKCKEDSGQIVLPIFYDVDPSDVRKQKRKYGEAFAEHELSENNKNKVESWKKSLFDASNIAGWEPKHVANGHEARCIQEIVSSILEKLSSLDSAVEDENLVGMGIRLEQLKSQLRIGSGGVRMVGIWGLGGGGKTTLATSLYKKISPNFDGCCFLGNIREETQKHGLKGLQEKLLSTVFGKQMQVESVELGKDKSKQVLCRRKVLIVLDDVDQLDQLEALAGCRKWFGDGSRIIITTRDQHLLTAHRSVDEVSPISLLSHEEAVRLFNKRAYNENKPVEDYMMLSQRIVSYAARLPLALIVLGSFLYDKDKDEWLSTLERLKYIPETKIVEKLKISYDGLTHDEKELFLDIACFHMWNSKNEAMEILDACRFYAARGVKVLIQKALISVLEDGEDGEDGHFYMHDLVHEVAHYIVRGEHPNNPEKHSRVWQEEDIEDICSRNATMENDKIEAIQCYGTIRSFNFIMLVSNMKKLRFLKVWTPSFDEGPSCLSNELRYLEWVDYPASPFPESFQPRKLVVLRMKDSLQKELWKGYKYLPCLKEMELSWMKALVRTPDFGGLPCLQKLTLYGCESLEEIHQSLGNHNSLVYLSVSECNKLTRFPSIVRMEKLEILKVSGCKALVEFPKIEANMDSLIELSLRYVDLYMHQYLPCLKEMKLSYMRALVRTPDFGGLPCLQKLIIKECESLEEIHQSLGNHNSLVNLSVSKCNKLTRFPTIVKMDKLEILKVSGCKALVEFPKIEAKMDLSDCGLSWCNLKDGEIPKEVGELSSLQELDLSRNDFTRLDFSLSRLTSLKLLDLTWCENLVELPELPSSLAILKADLCESLEVIKDDAHRRCKWLCQVSIIWAGRKNIYISGGERLLETMLQGMAVESRCMTLDVSAIARGFEPRLVRGRRCGMQLPENWYNHFYGFLFCAASKYCFGDSDISMKHVEKSVGDDVYWEETFDDSIRTRVTYLPFCLLRNTSWWDPTSTAVHVEFEESGDIYCGLKLVPKGGAAGGESSSNETTPTTHSSSSSSSNDDYKCDLRILHDSKSAFKFKICGQSKKNGSC